MSSVISRKYNRARIEKKYISKGRKNEIIQSYLMMSPQVIGFLVFSLYPILWAFRYAFYYYDGMDSTLRFVKFDNFVRLFTNDMKYWASLGNAFIILLGKLPIEMVLALIIGVALVNVNKGSNFYRTMYFLPYVISTAIIGLVFSNMFDAYSGVINGLLKHCGIITSNINWFGEKKTAMIVIMLASIWQNFGINVLYVYSAMMGIPEELYECAKLDGANAWQTFRKITLPMISPILQVIIMLAINGTLQMNDLVLVLTNGQPGGQTEVVMSYVLKNVINYNGDFGTVINVGYGSATALITAGILAVITIIYLKCTKKQGHQY